MFHVKHLALALSLALVLPSPALGAERMEGYGYGDGENHYTVEQKLESPGSDVVLLWRDNAFSDPTVRNYELWLCREEDDKRLLLPSTAGVDGDQYPTHRAPDQLFLNEDGSVLTYVYSFEDVLYNADGDLLHDSGTYTYRVDTATGELTVSQEKGDALSSPSLEAEGTTFVDVHPGDWFAPYVDVCVEHGLMNGVGDGQFAPQRTLSDEESTVLALRLHNIMQGGDGSFAPAKEWQYAVLTTADGTVLRASFTSGEGYSENLRWSWAAFSRTDSGKIAWSLSTAQDKAWGQALDFQSATMELAGKVYSGTTHLQGQSFLYFRPGDDVREEFQTVLIRLRYNRSSWYWDAGQYAVSQGLWELLTWYSSATRDTFAQKISAVADLPAINQVDRLPDADEEYILKLYRAGILTGVNSYGTFNKSGRLTRAEAAAMLARVLEPSLRLTFQ